MKRNSHLLWAGLFIVAVLFWQCHRKAVPEKSKAKAPSESKASKPLKSEDFETFYQKFHSDSLFQISRVQFPLKGQQIHLKGTSSWKKEKWLMIKAKASEVDRSVYNIKTLKKDDYYFEGIYCKNCIFTFEMEFRLLNGKWFLTYLNEKDE
jgi:hypothetical protein